MAYWLNSVSLCYLNTTTAFAIKIKTKSLGTVLKFISKKKRSNHVVSVYQVSSVTMHACNDWTNKRDGAIL